MAPLRQIVFVALSLAAMNATAARADQLKFKKTPKSDPLRPQAVGIFDGIKDGRVLYHLPPPPVDIQPPVRTQGTFSAFGVGGLAAGDGRLDFDLDRLAEVVFDGDRDWLSVTLKNGEFIRGHAESLDANFLRLKNQKPIRMRNVKEIVATEAPETEPADAGQ